MYEIIKNVILSKDFDLSKIIKNIDTSWAKGDFGDSERDELKKLARENVDVDVESDLMKVIEDLEERVRMLEEGKKPEVEEYPEFKAGRLYRNGDKITFEGKHYKCIAPKLVNCLFSPKVYPNFWEQLI